MALVLAVLVGMVMIVLGLLMVFVKTVVRVMESVKKRRRNVTVILDGWVNRAPTKLAAQPMRIKHVVGMESVNTDVVIVVLVTKDMQIAVHLILVLEMSRVNCVVVAESVSKALVTVLLVIGEMRVEEANNANRNVLKMVFATMANVNVILDFKVTIVPHPLNAQVL